MARKQPPRPIKNPDKSKKTPLKNPNKPDESEEIENPEDEKPVELPPDKSRTHIQDPGNPGVDKKKRIRMNATTPS